MLIKYNNHLVSQEKHIKILRPKTIGYLIYFSCENYPNIILDGQYDFLTDEVYVDMFFFLKYKNVWNKSFIRLETTLPPKMVITVLDDKTHNGMYFHKKYINFYSTIEKYIKYHAY